jgi:flagellar basal-body rod protein FlgC
MGCEVDCPMNRWKAKMINALNIAQSGLLAASAQLNVAANNIANLNTPGFKQQSTDFYSNGSDGVSIGPTEQTPSTGDGGNEDQQANTVDLAMQSVNLITAKLMYNANAAVVKTADQTIGTLLNLLDNRENPQSS